MVWIFVTDGVYLYTQLNITKMKIKIKNENLFNIQRQFGVYLLRCIPENRIYIGSTKQSFRARFSNHYKFLSTNSLENKKLQEDYNKYGEENFEFEILGVYDENLTVKYEQIFINSLKPYYNVMKAVNNSKTNWNKKLTEEHIEKIREKSLLYKHNKETLERISKLNKENSAQYLVTNINTNESFETTWLGLIDKFGTGCNKSVGKIYKKEWKIECLKKQAMKISLFIDNNWIEFNSFEKCDNFLNKWRGFTSTQKLKNVTTICGYNVKYN